MSEPFSRQVSLFSRMEVYVALKYGAQLEAVTLLVVHLGIVYLE